MIDIIKHKKIIFALSEILLNSQNLVSFISSMNANNAAIIASII